MGYSKDTPPWKTNFAFSPQNDKKKTHSIILVDPVINHKVVSFQFPMFVSHPYSSKHFEAIQNPEKPPESGKIEQKFIFSTPGMVNLLN